jgi:adenylylsulfate kinase
VKGLYQKARAGLIANYTGISSPYEAPENPDILLDSGGTTLEECVEQVIRLLKEREIIVV